MDDLEPMKRSQTAMGTKQNSSQDRHARKQRKRIFRELLDIDEQIRKLELEKIGKLKRYVVLKAAQRTALA